MLTELTIKNFAIIEFVAISFESGLTVLSGETGAGKSIIIDAIGLLVGGRGSSEFVRYGTDKAEIEGLFFFDEGHPCIEKCAEHGIELEENSLILKRDITTQGKSVCRINGKLVTNSVLREIGRTLVDIHGQHESQELMDPERHIHLLDAFHGEKIKEQLARYQEQFTTYETLKKRLRTLSENEQQMAHRLDLIQFQLNEIRSANLVENEDYELMEERKRISNFEKIYTGLNDAYGAFNDGNGLDAIRSAMYSLESIVDVEPAIKELVETVTNSYYLLEEASYTLRNHIDDMEYDPRRLDMIESRLSEISMLKKKYGSDVKEILIYADKIEEEISTIENKDAHIEQVKAELEKVTIELVKEGKVLSALRKQNAAELTESIHQELKHLYMEKTMFKVHIHTVSGTDKDPIVDGEAIKFTALGMDDVSFYISTNPGEPLKPIEKVASGGELSRIILALKSIFSKHQGITSIIFDEVDTGVSGRVAQAIAEKIYKVSVGSQVLCITHLPQVASMADTHLFIAKEVEGERTKTSVRVLTLDEKVDEVARMISGVEITGVTQEHARELICSAATLKEK
ncbi:MAG: DNA repair protein RecN [Bacillaceae bacterium]